MTTYHIAILHHVYMPDLQGKRQPRWHVDYHDDLIDYETVTDAQTQIDEWDNEVYVTDHNESGRPEYVIVDDVTADYIRGGRNMDMSNYDWDNAGCDCGECGTCFEIMIDQDRDYIRQTRVTK